MTRQSISFTQPNDDWLKAKVAEQEYASKSELVNDLIRKERARQDEIEFIRAKLIKAEQSGFSTKSKEELLAEFKAKRQKRNDV